MSIDPSELGLTRRSFLIKGSLFIASAAGLSCTPQTSRKHTANGSVLGANWAAGHELLKDRHPVPRRTEQTGIVIVGSGIAGLSAARELSKQGFSDFILLELDANIGGNAASGKNAVSPYPWGAHYIPLPGEDAVFVRELFEELGIITRYDPRGLPVYNEYYLCADPQERLLIHGQWQEGLVPQFGVNTRDRRQIREFQQAMQGFKQARGDDGKRAFCIPLDLSSSDARFRKYDAISMSRYLSDQGWDSEYLRWYVNYCCRDDYGCRMDDVSAWAGIHYFASRNGIAANADPHAVLTWPEGLGWIAARMAKKVERHVRTNACVVNIEQNSGGVIVDYLDAKLATSTRIQAKKVIYAAPRFTAARTIKGPGDVAASAARFTYAPWMIANLTMKGRPEGRGAELAWDNVSYTSQALGYVVANHQNLSLHRDKTALTYYFPLTAEAPSVERARALNRTYQEWAGIVLRDLDNMHPGIADKIEELNVWVWGHAMARPVPGFMWGPDRLASLKPISNIYFAHSDMSGISIFEEAQYRGIMAARLALQQS